PQLIIVDNNPFALLIAFKHKIRTIELLNPASVAGQLILNKEHLNKKHLDIFAQLKNIFGYSFIKNFLKRKNRIFITSIPQLEKEKFSKSTYLGPLFWKGWYKFPHLNNIPYKKSVFFTFGSRSIDKKYLKKLKYLCLKNNWQLMYSQKLINNQQSIRNADLVICHGGHTTILEALSAGVPLICLPQNEDQKIASLIVNNTKTGLVLNNSNSLEQSISRLLTNSSYKKNCLKIQNQLYSFPTKSLKI
ncbi:MAG: hypothetical protein KKA19_06735, partial [Candidatus Margulisbacteria bacterium]|nr:hypothetical protein [Candidatus Margulisiibacteriota bacterium]